MAKRTVPKKKSKSSVKTAKAIIPLQSNIDIQIAAVVPAYNEEKRIQQTIRQLQDCPDIDYIIVIDDGSTDNTYKIASKTDIILVRHEKNRGVGGAIKSGFKKAIEMNVDLAVIMAGDGQMPPSELPKFIQSYREGYGLIIGNRFDGYDPREYGMPSIRYYGAKILSLMTYIATGQKVPDSQNGYTALTVETLRKINVDTIANRWGVHNDIISRCALAGIPITSVPQEPKFLDQHGKRIGSKHFVLNIIYPNLKVFFRALGRRSLNSIGIKRI